MSFVNLFDSHEHHAASFQHCNNYVCYKNKVKNPIRSSLRTYSLYTREDVKACLRVSELTFPLDVTCCVHTDYEKGCLSEGF